jgi:hypothetical protein
MAAKRRTKCNNQQQKCGINGREMGWDERTTGAQGGARFDHFGGKRVEGGGGTKVKSINLLNYIISQPI